MQNELNPTRRHVVATGTAGALGLAAAAASLAACGSGSTGTNDGATSGSTTSGSTASGSTTPTGAATPGGPLAKLSAVPVGGAVTVKAPDGTQVIIAQPEAGKVVAFSAICTHRGCLVVPKGTKLECPCHSATFDAFTGKVLTSPADSPLPAIAVVVKGDDIVAG